MHRQTFPEDSMLRRHFDSTVEWKRQAWLTNPPSDSILRRHSLGAGPQAAAATNPNPAGRAGGAARVTSSVDAGARPRQAATQGKGFFAWLAGLFKG